MRPVKIHSNRVNHGIIASLKNSRRINKLSSKLVKNDEYLALVMYYYALEEFGKAIYLEETKAKMPNQEEITLYLHAHTPKLQRIRKHHRELLIKRQKFIKSKIQSGSKIKKIYVGIIEKSMRDILNIDKINGKRTGFWLVDYDYKTKHWNQHKNIRFDDEQLKNNIRLLFRKIRNMEKNYKK